MMQISVFLCTALDFIGGLYSILLSVTANKIQEIVSKPGASICGQQWLEAFQYGADAVSKYGGASLGDRTMVMRLLYILQLFALFIISRNKINEITD